MKPDTNREVKDMTEAKVPIWEKACLTIEEAAEYSHIGENTLRDRIAGNDFDFILRNGNRTLIKRKRFEKYLDSISVI